MISDPSVLFAFRLMNKEPMELFIHGGVVMWPMLFLSLVALTVVLERVFFALTERFSRNRKVVEEILSLAAKGDDAQAVALGSKSKDFLARILAETLANRGPAMQEAFVRASSKELARYSMGLPVMDTAITAAPLLGLLGTVTGMMEAFGKTTGGLDAQAVTGGIAEALIATASGLFIAVVSLVPYNYLNTMLEDARREIDEVGATLELSLSEGSEDGETAPARA